MSYRTHTPSTIHPDTRTAAEKATDREIAEAALDARFAEFETPETDPAESDPAEAEPDWARADETDVCGCGQPAAIVSRYGVSLCMTAARVAGLGELADSLNACPVHGAGCAAWEG